MKRSTLALLLALATGPALHAQPAFTRSYTAGSADAAGRFMGGTEIRSLVAHAGKLFAGNGYWKDVPGPEGAPGAQILRLDRADGTWQVDTAFDAQMPSGQRRHIAVSALAEATFHTDARGNPLPVPQTVLLASTWDLTGARTVFSRNDRTGAWTGAVLAQDRPAPNFLPQIRAFGTHHDRLTGVDLVFAGDTRGIYAGRYDPVGDAMTWAVAPEWLLTPDRADGFPGLAGRVRISSFAEADGRLFAAIGQQVWVRTDGPAAQWQPFYTNPSPQYSQTGLRGLTAIIQPGGGPGLLAVTEGLKSRIIRIDARTGADATELDLAALLDTAWHTRVSYVIGAYNDMARLPLPDGRSALLIGLESFVPRAALPPPCHTLLDVNHGLEAGGWLVIRQPNGQYNLQPVVAPARQDLVAVRSAVASPFPGGAGTVYLGGYDANDAPAHNTAWIMRGRIPGGPGG